MPSHPSDHHDLGHADRGRQPSDPGWVRFLHLSALTALALAQPLFDLLSKAPEFFAAHRSEPGDIFLLVAVVGLAVPGAGMVLEVLVGLVSKRAAQALHGLLVTALFVLLILGAVRDVDGVSAPVILGMTVIAGGLCGFLYLRLSKLRSFVTLLSVSALAFPALFLLRPPVSGLVFEPPKAAAANVSSSSRTPIVFIVFDELPLASLLRRDGAVNKELFPSFAALAETADWFTNATSVAEATRLSVPSILSGRYERDRSLKEVSEGLFTLVASSHELVAFEQSFSHCPEDLCSDPLERIPQAARIRLLFSDVAVIYQHLLWPAPLREALPPIDLGWRDFAGLDAARPRGTDTVALMERFIESIDRAEQPALHYMHPNFPHTPWKLLPSGREYGPLSMQSRPFGLKNHRWTAEERFVIQGWQRHLLQVIFADRVLGRVVDKLKTEGLFDETLIVVTADHGMRFVPGKMIRASLGGAEDADVLRVPILIKRPNQTNGRTRSEAVETIDIFPTVAELLGIESPWPVDGQSLVSDGAVSREIRTAFVGRRVEKRTYPVGSLVVEPTLARKVAIFGEDPEGLFAFGPLKHLVNRSVSAFDLRPASGLTAVLEDESEYENVAAESGRVPAFVVGRLLHEQPLPSETHLAIAVNGTIRAGARLTPTKRGEGRFAALVPERSFVSGYNEIDVFIVTGDPGDTALTRAERPPSETYRLGENGIEGRTGKVWTLGTSTLRGTVEQKNWEFKGWAADRQQLRPAERILLFVDGEFVTSAPVSERSPKLGQQHGEKLGRSGFLFGIPFSRIPRGASVRLFALSGESAVELRYGKSFRLGPPSPPPNSRVPG